MYRLSRPFLFITALAVIGTAFWFSNSRANSGLFSFHSSSSSSTTQTGSKLQPQPELLQIRKSDDGIWEDVEPSQIQARYPAGVVQRNVAPIAFRTINLDHTALEQILQRAPLESVETGVSSAAIISLPMPDGKFARFRFVESPIMESELATRYPDLKTYAGQGIDDPTAVVRFDTVPQGFHAIILSVHGTTYIDPYLKNNTEIYASYYKRNFRKDAEPFRCLFENPLQEDPESAHTTRSFQPNLPTGANLRTYRTAVGTTGEYTAAAGGGTLLGGLGAVITTVNRVSAVYERDLAIRLVLVNNQDRIIYTNASTDPYSNSNASALLSENQSNLDSVIGSANYDIGHVFSTGGGGLAGLGVVCRSGQKARGETGSGNPVGDPYDIDYVAHEMGHQFGGNHPFNGNTGNCAGGNRNGSTAYEVGSGNTIMAYAGICDASDIQPNSDDYFHAISYQEIDTYTSTGAGNCGASTATGNTPPTIAALSNFTIPNQTPFTLTASASDPNAGDVLTYCWEEFDLGPTQNPTVSPRDNGSSPIFRSYDPVTSPSRTFPALQYILNNANVPPATISLPGISGTFASGEFLPTTNRTMTFRVTVRDNRLNGGGSNRGQMTVTSTTSAGPFAVTAPNTATSVAINSALNVTWNVAGTTANGVNTANVRILLSTDGGYTFPTVLTASTPNDGSQSVLIPNDNAFATTQARIKVEAIGNVFFDISNTNFTITGTNTAPTVNITGSVTILRGSPSVTTNVGTVADGQDGAGTLAVALLNLPFELTATAANNNGTLSVTAASECSLVTTNTSKTYPITVTVTDSAGATRTGTINIVVQPNLTPTLGNYTNPPSTLPGSSRTVTPSAPPADGNNAISTVTVSPTTLPGGGTLSVDSAGVVTVNTTGGTTNGTYTVFVTVQDICGAAVVRSFTLTVSGPVITIVPAGSTITAGNCGSPATSAIDPGETVTVSLGLQNTGTTSTSNMVATLQNSGGITPITTSQTYGALTGGGAAVSRSYQFTANGTCGATVTATLQLQDGVTNLGNATFTFVLGGGAVTNIFTQNFDGVTAPTLPSGWTTSVLTGSVGNWATTSTNPDTAANTAFTNGITSAASNALRSPSIALPAGSVSAVLSFRHAWNFETSWDGGVLEISTNGGSTWTDALTLGATFTANGYSSTLNTGSFPLSGRQAWTGSQASYVTTSVNLPTSLNGQSIQIRWRGGWDTSTANTNPNWRVDTVSIATPSCSSCSSCPTINGNVSGTATICSGNSTNVSVTVSGGTGPYNVTLSNGGGTQNGAGPTFTFPVSPTSTTTYTVSGTDSNTCSITNVGSAVVTVNQPPAGANAGPDQTICTGGTTLAASQTTGTGVWSIVTGPNTSTSQFSSTTAANATFTPTTTGVYTLQWTVSNAPCAGTSTDTVVITVNAGPPTANAGGDQTLCFPTTATLAANNPSPGTGAWTVVTGPNTSTAQFSNTASATSTFTPTLAGTYTLRWTITQAPCPATNDTVVLTYTASPSTANAGADQSTCVSGNVTLAANNPGVGAGTWSVASGPSTSTAQFSNVNAFNATFTPAGGAGLYTLQWTITNAPCTASSDQVVIDVAASCGSGSATLYVADTTNNRVQKFNGTTWTVVGTGTTGTGNGQFKTPEAVTASLDGVRIYVADTGNNRIQWSTNSGATWANFATSGTGLSQVSGPRGLALDSAGNLYVADGGNNRVLRFNGGTPGTGVLLAASGTTSGRVRTPNGLAVDSNFNLFIADTLNNRILKVTNANTRTNANTGTVLAGLSSGLTGVRAPQGLAVDSANNLYVADTGNNRVIRFAGGTSGTATLLAGNGTTLGLVRAPEGVTISVFTAGSLTGGEFLVVSDTTNNRIQGRLLSSTTWTLVGTPNGLGSGLGQFRAPSKIR